MTILAYKLTKTKLHADLWLILDKSFVPTDKLARYYAEEIPLLRDKPLEDLQSIQSVKLAFPDSKITARVFLKAPPLTYSTQFTKAQIKAIWDYSQKKFPDSSFAVFQHDNAWTGFIGEQAFKRFVDEYQIPHTWHSENVGPDKLDFEIGKWMIDVKTLVTASAFRKDFRVVVDMVHLKKNTIINTYSWVHLNPKTLVCTLLGWTLRKEFFDNATFHKKGERTTPHFVCPVDLKDLARSELRAEAFYVWEYPGKV